MATRRLVSLIVLSLAPLTGCTLLHSNIKGGFACAAPRGTCAPSMTIDDAAISAIGGPHAQTGDKTSADTVARTLAKREWTFVPGGRPALKVVFPAWRDGAGQWHPRTSAYTPLDVPPAPMPATAPLDGHDLGGPPVASLLALAEMAPEIATLAAPPTPAFSPTLKSNPADTGQSPATSDAKPTPQSRPTASAVAPLDAIKAEVKQILSAGAKTAASSPNPLKADGEPAKPAASFPPAGN